jgi:hypothetical protein
MQAQRHYAKAWTTVTVLRLTVTETGLRVMGRKLCARKAQCMVCERSFIVRSDGHIRNHIVPGSEPSRRCVGGGVLADGFEWMKKEDE